MKKRLLFSAVFISISIYAMFFSPYWFFFMVVWAFSMLGLNEYLQLAEKKGVQIHRPVTLTLGAILPFSMIYSAEAVVLAILCLIVFVLNFKPDLKDKSLVNVAVTVFGLVYVSWFFSHLIKFRSFDNGGGWIFYLLLVVKGGDAGAYFIGKKYGKRKLVEHISPKKSVEGAIAGWVTGLILSLLSRFYLSVPLGHLFVLGALLGVVALLGDLAESLLKRDAGIKDSGNVPGLGGILDVLDSLLISIPLVYYYISAFSSLAGDSLL